VDSLYGFCLEELHIFGSYAQGKQACCDLDFLLLYNEDKMYEYIDSHINDYTIKLYTESYDFENEQIDVDKLQYFLRTNEFWDFRKCNEYPECLECYEHEECEAESIKSSEFYMDLHDKGVHNYCIETCSSPIKSNSAIPTCCKFPSYCSFTNNNFRNQEIKWQILSVLQSILKEGADVPFERSGLEVKVLHFNIKRSLEDFKLGNSEFSLDDLTLIAQR
jgi:hypothetical protein